MSKKQEALGRYLSDLMRTVGIALVLFSGLGLAFNRVEAIDHLGVTIAFGALGCALILAGALVVLKSTIEN